MTPLKWHHVHLIGIGGSGLSAIARVLLESGVAVSGSDRQLSPLAQAVQAAGAVVFTGHRPENVIVPGKPRPDLVVRSSAIPDDNPEIQAARAAGIPVLKRAGFLGDLTAGYKLVAVAGTHGKTTTTAMIAWMLTRLGLDPSFIVGGVSANLGTNAHAGSGSIFVIEADEYDHMFLGLNPGLAVVTNVEHDHPDCYPTPQDFYQAFSDFVSHLAPEGFLLACMDDRGARRLLQESQGNGRRTSAYGLSRWPGFPTPDYFAADLVPNQNGGFSFRAVRRQDSGGDQGYSVCLQVPGLHNVSNALAVFSVADLLTLPLADAAQSLGEFKGTGRRFEIRGEAGGVTVIDDYAHHPTEIRATLAAARQRYADRCLWAVWQPHTYSRTRTLLKDFSSAFEDADHVLVTKIYAAREAPPADGFSARHIVAAMSHPDVRAVDGVSQASAYLLDKLQPGDVLLVLSAGDADQISAQVMEALEGSAADG